MFYNIWKLKKKYINEFIFQKDY